MTTSTDLLAAAATDQELQVELVRMCVAEAGYDPTTIQPYDGPTTGFAFWCIDGSVPHDVCWRARELVGIGEPKCFACTMRDNATKVVTGCGADRRLLWDCANDQLQPN